MSTQLEHTDTQSLAEELEALRQLVKQQEQEIEVLRQKAYEGKRGPLSPEMDAVRKRFLQRVRPLVDPKLLTPLQAALSAIFRARYGVSHVAWLKPEHLDEMYEIADTIASFIERRAAN